jgi:CHAT domain-containing protein
MTFIRSTACSLLLALVLALGPPPGARAGVGNADTAAGEDEDLGPGQAPAAATPAPAAALAVPRGPSSVPVAPMAVPIGAVAPAGDGEGRCAGGRPPAAAPAPPAPGSRAAQALAETEAAAAIAAEGRALLSAEAQPRDGRFYCEASAALADRGEYRAAIQAASMALFLGQQDGDRILMAHAARNLAYAYSLAGALDPAQRWADETLRLAGAGKDPRVEEALLAPALKVKADVALRRGRAAEATGFYRQAVGKLGKSSLRPWYVLALARAELARGQTARAAELLAEARRGAPAALSAGLARAEGELALAMGEHGRAAARFKAAAAAAGDDATVRMWALHGLGRAQRAAGDRGGALGAFILAAETAEAVRGRFRSEEFKAGFFGSAQDIFDDAVAAAADAGEAERALDLSERSRSRALLDLLVGRVQASSAGLTFVERLAVPVPVAALRTALPRDAAVVVYHLLADRGFAWVLRPGELKQVALSAGRSGLSASIAAFLQAVRRDDPETVLRAQQLHAALVAPLGLGPEEALLAVGHDALHLLPFAALHDGRAWLVERRAVAGLPSLNALGALLGAGPAPGTGALVMGNPDLGDPAYDLPAAEHEAAAIAARLAGAALYTRGAATRERLRAEAPGKRLVHVAAHATVDELDPLASPLYLAGNGTAAAMTARDFYAIDLRAARLIALSGCETGLGKIGRGDEFWGFQRTVLAAGARAMLVSLWPVEDEATALLMTRFYELAADRPAIAALREAQRTVLRARPSQPIFWAGFVLVGDWR